MSDYDNANFRLATETEPEPEDYTGEDGLLYCGSCRQPKEAYFAEGKSLFGRDRHPKECDCQRKRQEKQEANHRERRHRDTVEELKRRGFSNTAMRQWTFENDNGKCPQMDKAFFYAANWEEMKAENIGYLLWGKVGTGKSYFAGCIANALMEREISVCMTNFALILNDLAASYKGRNEYIDRLCRFPLLILDDFGMERGTEYRLEQVYNVVDSRYRSQKPLIVTTNLTLEELQHPEDTAHARIYDRLLEMCFKAETLLYCALIGYIHYEAPVEEQNFSTLIEFINAMEVREDDEEYKNPVDLMFDALESEKPNHFAVRQYKKYKLAAGVIKYKRLLNQNKHKRATA